MMMRKFFQRTKPVPQMRAELTLFNTLGKEKQRFIPHEHASHVRMYCCGPTVYGVQHIGNLSMFVFTDVLRRTLEYTGLPVKQVINITDFGHLSSDADEGEDKMTKGLTREGMEVSMENMAKLAERYTTIFLKDLVTLNIETDKIEFPRASGYVPAQIAMIQTLAEKGYAYELVDGVYYDTSRFPEYGALGGIDLKGLKEGARIATHADKRNATDFILWKKDASMGWESPWGKGFPGWHIECSAMARSCLGEQIDIHTGGIEHIPIHHNNEIAQSEAATGKKPFSRFWLHRAHIQIEGSKIAKSEGNVVYLSEISERGFHPLALRYLFLGAHYRTNANFSWAALEASQRAYAKLLALVLSAKEGLDAAVPAVWREKFIERINDDIDTPGALAVLWEMSKDTSLSDGEIRAMLLEADKVLGLNLSNPDELARAIAAREIKIEVVIETLPEHVQALIKERAQARIDRRWEYADTLRAQIDSGGFVLEDTADSVRVFKK